MPAPSEPILVKRNAQRRLYDTRDLRYLSVANLREWRCRGVVFVVREAETGADITQVLLAERR
jgi:polyhydroxyalkanoate synthesis regulator protein